MTKNLSLLLASCLFAVGASAADAAAPAAANSPAPTDPQIAAIVVAANNADIEAGKMAKSISKNDEVKRFAEEMIADHTSVNRNATDLVKKLKVTPEENDMSRSLKKGGDESMAKLRKMKGKDFDKAYVDHEVEYHQSVIDSVDKVLLPSAKNPELKAMLTSVRPNLVSHLEHAKHVQSTMK